MMKQYRIIVLLLMSLCFWKTEIQAINTSKPESYTNDTLSFNVGDIVNMKFVDTLGKSLLGTVMILDDKRSLNINSPASQYIIEKENTCIEIRKMGYKPYRFKIVVGDGTKNKVLDLSIQLVGEQVKGLSRIVKRKEQAYDSSKTKVFKLEIP